jgi:hypothetical protein
MKRALEQAFAEGIFEDYTDDAHRDYSNLRILGTDGKTVYTNRQLFRSKSEYGRGLLDSKMRENEDGQVISGAFASNIINMLINFMMHAGCSHVYPIVEFSEREGIDIEQVLIAADYFRIKGVTECVDICLSYYNHNFLVPYFNIICKYGLVRCIDSLAKDCSLPEILITHPEVSLEAASMLLAKRLEHSSVNVYAKCNIIKTWIGKDPEKRAGFVETLARSIKYNEKNMEEKRAVHELYMAFADDTTLGKYTRQMYRK